MQKKANDPCNSNNVPDETLINEVDQIQSIMLEECKKAGGSLEVRVLYGCTNDKRLGDSKRISWPPEGYRDRELTEADKLYLAQKLKELMEEAEKESIGRRCPSGSDTVFRVQGLCRGKNGEPIKRPGHTYENLPPFTPTNSNTK